MSTDTREREPGARPSPPAYTAPARSRGLDGLRAPAVAAVVAYHVDAGALPGGFIGVDLFFVISGYLITSLLAAERRRSGRLRLGAFWVRRARRLLPAMWAVLVVASCTATLVGGDTYAGLRGNVAAALTYSSNWWQIARHDAYFAGVGGRPVLQHLWSLAVEEQFYVLWPLLLWAVMTVLRRQRHQAAFALVLACVCFTAMGTAYSPDTDTSRVYYGTDTHGGGLLLGAAAALMLPLARAATLRRPGCVRALDALGGAGALGLVAAAAVLDGTSAAYYRGGLVLVCLASVAVTLAASAPGRFAAVLSAAPLAAVGRRSYGIYLWHWPVIACLSAAAPDFAARAAGRWTELALTGAMAAVSFRLLEEPLIRLGVRGYLAAAHQWFRERHAVHPRQTVALAAVGAGVVVVAYLGVSHAPAATGLQAQIAAGERAAGDSPVPAAPEPVPARPATAARRVLVHGAAARDPGGARRTAAGREGGAGRPAVAGGEMTAVGDSVMLASVDALRRDFPGIAVDARVGRQMAAAPGVLRELAGAGRLRRTVVLGLGTNGPFPGALIDDVLRITGPAHTVAFVDVHVPRPWQSQVNSVLARAVRAHPGTLLVGWDAAVSGRPGLLWDDRTHPRPSGAAVYAGAVRAALAAAAGRTGSAAAVSP
jgi:peptidoglycan/LPS O-acetylase OafA/YrhL